MNEQPNSQPHDSPATPSPLWRRTTGASIAPPPDPRIEDYLDQVYAPLVDVAPYARRQELRTELREHLEALAATHEALGSSREAAVLAAFRQFGPPRDLARQWMRGEAPDRPTPAWRAALVALGCFGVATLLAFKLLTAACPDGFAWYYDEIIVLLVIGGILPLLGGIATGLVARARPAFGSFLAVAALFLPTVFVAMDPLNHSPDKSGLASAALLICRAQALLWMPIGCGAAAWAGTLRARLLQRPARWVLQ
jgi:hypothetical protein